MASDTDAAKVREYVRLLENPYASLQVRGVEDEDPATAKTGESLDAVSAQVATPTQVDLFPAPPRHSALTDVPSGNPYASLANIDDEEQSVAKAHNAAADPPELSKASFEGGCRRIFSQYIPRLERGRLRPEHRDFITRNRSRSARIRFRLLEELSRYDLSDLPGMQPQFNREDDRLTAKKLTEIEQAVDKDE
jgi:hypothetical protein